MFKPHEFPKKIGVSVKTLQRWDSVGKLPAKRTLSGHRFYTIRQGFLTPGGLGDREALLQADRGDRW